VANRVKVAGQKRVHPGVLSLQGRPSKRKKKRKGETNAFLRPGAWLVSRRFEDPREKRREISEQVKFPLRGHLRKRKKKVWIFSGKKHFANKFGKQLGEENQGKRCPRPRGGSSSGFRRKESDARRARGSSLTAPAPGRRGKDRKKPHWKKGA